MNPASTDEISRILHTSRDVKSFYQHFLAASASMAGAQVGVAWRGEKAPFQPVCQVHAKSAGVAKLSISEQRHNELLEQAAASRKAFLILPQDKSAGEPLLMFGTVRRDDITEVVEFILPPETRADQHVQIVSNLDAYCNIASQYREHDGQGKVYAQSVEAPDAAGAGPGPTSKGFRPLSREQVDQYAHLVHGSLDYKETASLVANEARRVLDCDRVSVVLRKGNDYKIVAISGQPSVNRRSNTVSMLRRLAKRTLKTGERFWYPDDAQLPPQIEKPLNEYLGVSATRSLAIVPVFDRIEEDDADPELLQHRRRRPKVVAGLIIEHCNEQWDRQLVAPGIETIVRHGGDAIRNSLGHRQLFGYGLWRLLGKSSVVMAARNLSKTAAVLIGTAVLAAVLTFVPAPFTLNCDGVLLPEKRAKIYAGQNGLVSEVVVAHGDFVSTGDVLLKLENEDIAIELEEIEAEIERQKQRLENNKVLRSTDRDLDNRRSVEDNVQSIQAQIQTLKSRQTLLNAKAAKLNIESSLTGQVITWDLDTRLKDRPVRHGETLMEIADVDGQWELELDLPDRRAGHLLAAFEKQKSEDGEGLEVSYQLAAEPGTTFTGRVVEFSRASQLTASQTQTVKVIVSIDAKDIARFKQARSGVSAKIHCGTEPLGYVWLHDVYEFIQSKLVFRMW